MKCCGWYSKSQVLKTEDEKWFKLTKNKVLLEEIVCNIITCGFHFDRTIRINYEKCDEKCYDQWYLRILLNACNY